MSADAFSDKSRPVRSQYRFFTQIQTRWSDNDMYGHLNNVQYNRFFEAVITAFFQSHVPHDLIENTIVPVVAEVLTRFRSSLSFPETVDGGLRISHLGRSSVKYELALFREGDEDASAHGHWVDVFVDRETNRTVPVPEGTRRAFENYMGPDSSI